MKIIAAFLLVIAGEIARELCVFHVTRYTVTSPKLSGLKASKKIVFLSDLHNYCYRKDNEPLFRAVAKEAGFNPDWRRYAAPEGSVLLYPYGKIFVAASGSLSRILCQRQP